MRLEFSSTKTSHVVLLLIREALCKINGFNIFTISHSVKFVLIFYTAINNTLRADTQRPQ